MSVVTLRAAVCVLGRFPALAGADLDVDEGEVVLLTGANGAGKTTLLRLVAGLVALRSGSARVLGVDLARDRRSHRRQLAFVGHDTGCYDDLGVRDNLRFAVRLAGGDTRRADDAMERAGLTAQAGVAHRRLSAGQRKRLALAIVMARDARLLLLDEPHASLDADGRAMLDEYVADAVREGRSVLLASHETDRARALAPREVLVDAGMLHGGLHGPERLETDGARPPEQAPEPAPGVVEQAAGVAS